jgi:Fur family ferric uptake transcriptional regulator
MSQNKQGSSHGALLRRLGIRQTPQRLLIVSVLQRSQTCLSIEDILTRVHQHTPGISAATVYRTLALLERAGVIWRVSLPGEGIPYLVASGESGHLLVCQGCRRVVAFDYDLDDLSGLLEGTHRFHAVRPSIVATGYCELCWLHRSHHP